MNDRFAIINGSVLDGTGSPPLRASIVVSQGTIESVGPAPSDCETIDMAGCTVLPGFVNAHAHPGFKAVGDTELHDYEPGWLAEALRAGVTTVRDMGGFTCDTLERILRRKEELNATGDYPRIVSAGKFVSAPGGYGGAASITVSSVGEARENVERAIASGADFIKTSLENGYSPETALPKLSQEQLAALCDTARAHGRRVAAHMSQCEPLRMLAEAGITDAAHAPYEPMGDGLIRLLVEKGVVLTPTLTLYRMFQERYGAPVLAAAIENTRRFAAAGGTVAVGDDCLEPLKPWYAAAMPFGELELLAQAGMSNPQILTALTKNGAAACGLGAVTGTLEPGKAADVAVVRGDPLTDLRCLKDVALVVLRGRIVHRAS